VNFKIKLFVGSDLVESIPSWVPTQNDFGTASMMAVAALFARSGPDNVSAHVVVDGREAMDYFFMGEKG
jgi:hypothetical protein